MAEDHHCAHGRSRYEQRYAADPRNSDRPARANTFGGQLREDVLGAITHVGIFVHLVAPDADGRHLPMLAGPAEFS
jgi:hypothetical protein